MKVPGKVAIGVRSETTQGTAVVPAATDFFYAMGVDIEPIADILQRDNQRATYGSLAHVVGKKHVTVKFKTEFKSNGIVGGTIVDAGTSYRPLGMLLKACGFSETVSAGVSITYAPITTTITNFLGGATSCTLEIYKDGIKHIVAGCVGDWNLSLEVNKLPYIEFTFYGIYAAATDAALPSQTLAAQLPAVWQNSTIAIHTYAANVKKWDISPKNAVTLVESTAATAVGIAGFQITGKDPSGSIEVETVAIATFSPINLMMTGANASSSFTIGGTGGNIITVTMAKTQFSGVKYGEFAGGVTSSMGVNYRDTSGDDWISIVLT